MKKTEISQDDKLKYDIDLPCIQDVKTPCFQKLKCIKILPNLTRSCMEACITKQNMDNSVEFWARNLRLWEIVK